MIIILKENVAVAFYIYLPEARNINSIENGSYHFSGHLNWKLNCKLPLLKSLTQKHKTTS